MATFAEKISQKRKQIREAWPRWLRRADLAEYLSISPSQIDKWCNQAIIPTPVKIAGIVLWDRFAVDESMESQFYPETDVDLTDWDDVSA